MFPARTKRCTPDSLPVFVEEVQPAIIDLKNAEILVAARVKRKNREVEVAQPASMNINDLF